jgi:hypothetical protein
VDTKADATVSLGVIANGTLVPPNVTQFEVTVGMTANLSGTVNLLADVTVRTPRRGFGYFLGLGKLTFGDFCSRDHLIRGRWISFLFLLERSKYRGEWIVHRSPYHYQIIIIATTAS